MSINPDRTEKIDLSISMVKANIYGLIVLLPVVLLGLFYIKLWGLAALKTIPFGSLGRFLILIFFGIVVHEGLHGLVWILAGKKWNVTFGIHWKTLSPYAHCKAPLNVEAYRIGVALPGLILGLFPTGIGLFTGSHSAIVFGLIFILAAGGDALVLWLIRNVQAGSLVEDHPSRVGCYALTPRPLSKHLERGADDVW